MNSVKVNVKYLLSIMLIAPKKDVRYYLNGVHLTNDYMEATDGTMALRFNSLTGGDITASADDEPKLNVILDIHSLAANEKTLKTWAKLFDVIFFNVDYQTFSLDDTQNTERFKVNLVEGVFPQMDRLIVPIDKMSGIPAIGFNVENLAKVGKINKILGSNSPEMVRIHHNGEFAARFDLLHKYGKLTESEFFGIIMPFNKEHYPV